jgi:hypothetical protein
MESQKKRASEMTPEEFERALRAADARGPRPLTHVETREPYGSSRFYKGPSSPSFWPIHRRTCSR